MSKNGSSLGMNALTLLVGLALAVGWFFFVESKWEKFSVSYQLSFLAVMPALLVLAMVLAARLARSGYLCSLLGSAAFGCFAINAVVLVQIFHTQSPQGAFLACGVFGLALAYTVHDRLLLVLGLGSLAFWISALIAALLGLVWVRFPGQVEGLLLAGLLLLAMTWLVPFLRRDDFLPVYRVVGLSAILVSFLVLAIAGQISYLTVVFDFQAVELAYQVVGLAVSAATVWIGIRWRWRAAVQEGRAFFVAILYACFYGLLFRLIGHSLGRISFASFLLVVGLTTGAVLVVLNRLRSFMAVQTWGGD